MSVLIYSTRMRGLCSHEEMHFIAHQRYIYYTKMCDDVRDCQFKLYVILHDYFKKARRKKKTYDKDRNLSRSKENFFPYYCSYCLLFFFP